MSEDRLLKGVGVELGLGFAVKPWGEKNRTYVM